MGLMHRDGWEPVAATAVEGDGEVVTGRRNLTAADADVPLGQAAGDVQAQGIVDAGVVEDAGVDHAGGAAVAFFCRLEGQADRAAQAVFVLVEDFGDAQEIGCMAVMAAGVHDAVDEGRIRAVEFFRQRQGVDIGPQEDDRTGQGAVNQAGDACAGDDFNVFDAHEGQFLEYRLARIEFFFTQFRMGMEIFAHFHHIR